MELLNQKTIAENVYERWCHQYPDSRYSDEKDKMAIKKKLKGVTNVDEINKIIGNDSWTALEKCNECGLTSKIIVRLGENEDYDSKTAYMCKGCLVKAILLANPINDIHLRSILLFATAHLVMAKRDNATDSINTLDGFIKWLEPFLELNKDKLK